MRVLPWLSLTAFAACATAPPKMPYDEAMRHEPEAAPRGDLLASRPLAEAMEAFRAQAELNRKAVTRGAAMPPAQVLAWERMLTEVDVFLERGLHHSSTLDTVRTRLQLQTEVESDTQTYGDVPPELAERVTATLSRLTAKLALQTAVHQRRADPSKFRWPVEPVVVTSPYGHRVHPLYGEYRFHAGLDLEAELAQPVYAVEAGTVAFAGWNAAHGRQVELQHDAHVASRYSHLMTVLAAPGAQVKRGDVIGLAGKSGRATGVHLHFELRRDGEAVDPELSLPDPLHPKARVPGAARANR